MPRRKVLLVNKEIYHVYNKTVGNELALKATEDIKEALKRIKYYSILRDLRYSMFIKNNNFDTSEESKNTLNNKLVEIFAYALMPNHFHFLIKQKEDNGVRIFLTNFQNSYARYYNIKNKRNGSLFQNRFKAKLITTTEQLIHLVRYIHLNPITSYIMEFEDLKNTVITSYQDYINKQEKSILNTDFILKEFQALDKFMSFHSNQVDFQRKLNKIKNLFFD
jgi:putative transposase